MKTLEIEVPDQVAEALKGLVEQGWFASEADLLPLQKMAGEILHSLPPASTARRRARAAVNRCAGGWRS